VPTAEILSAAATTSVVSVGAALIGTSIFQATGELVQASDQSALEADPEETREIDPDLGASQTSAQRT
jgi:hypothetical protein